MPFAEALVLVKEGKIVQLEQDVAGRPYSCTIRLDKSKQDFDVLYRPQRWDQHTRENRVCGFMILSDNWKEVVHF